MQNLLKELIQLLAEDERLVSEGKLLKNKVIELALNMDAGLIKTIEIIKKQDITLLYCTMMEEDKRKIEGLGECISPDFHCFSLLSQNIKDKNETI